MRRVIISAIIFLLPVMAISKDGDIYKTAVKECQAFNNMKHSKNTNGVKLKKGQEYRVVDHKKGQILTIIKGEQIAQRWVDESCLIDSKKSSVKLSKQNLLALSWQNAFCETHRNRKECKSMKRGDFASSHFVLHGLWPQPRNNLYCNVSKKEVGIDKNRQWHRLSRLDLTPSVREDLKKYMSGYSSNLHLHEWIKHGTCYGKDANGYYKDAIELLKQLNSSKVQEFFQKNSGKVVKLKEIRDIFDSEFGKGAGEKVAMVCKKGLITELWLYLGSGSSDLKTLFAKGAKTKSRCFKGKIDEVGYNN
jgi:ribonuclease T2